MMTQFHEYLLDFFMTLFALSSLALWCILFSGGSFSAYAVLVLVVPLVTGYLIMVNGRGHIIPDAPVETAAEHYGNRFRIESVAILALLLFIFFSQSNLVMVVLLLIALFLFLRQKRLVRGLSPPFRPWKNHHSWLSPQWSSLFPILTRISHHSIE